MAFDGIVYDSFSLVEVGWNNGELCAFAFEFPKGDFKTERIMTFINLAKNHRFKEGDKFTLYFVSNEIGAASTPYARYKALMAQNGDDRFEAQNITAGTN